jgi:hypothetical protein
MVLVTKLDALFYDTGPKDVPELLKRIDDTWTSRERVDLIQGCREKLKEKLKRRVCVHLVRLPILGEEPTKVRIADLRQDTIRIWEDFLGMVNERLKGVYTG